MLLYVSDYKGAFCDVDGRRVASDGGLSTGGRTKSLSANAMKRMPVKRRCLSIKKRNANYSLACERNTQDLQVKFRD